MLSSALNPPPAKDNAPGLEEFNDGIPLSRNEMNSNLISRPSVLRAVFEVSNTLGSGFLEKVYERALLRELGLRGIRATA